MQTKYGKLCALSGGHTNPWATEVVKHEITYHLLLHEAMRVRTQTKKQRTAHALSYGVPGTLDRREEGGYEADGSVEPAEGLSVYSRLR